MGKRGPEPQKPWEEGRELQERQDADRREAAGQPREATQADDVARHPGEGDYE